MALCCLINWNRKLCRRAKIKWDGDRSEKKVNDNPDDPLTRWPNDPVPCMVLTGRPGRRRGCGGGPPRRRADQRTTLDSPPLRHTSLLAGQGNLGLVHATAGPLHGHLHAVRRRVPPRRGHHPRRRRRRTDRQRVGGTCRQRHRRPAHEVRSSALYYRHIRRHHVHHRHRHQLPHHLRRRRRGQYQLPFSVVVDQVVSGIIRSRFTRARRYARAVLAIIEKTLKNVKTS